MWASIVAVQSFFWIGVICGKGRCGGGRTFPCWNGGCTVMHYACDNDNDCEDNSDQNLCGPRCPKHSYECTSGSECYHYSKRCDGRLDCSDASDETDCDHFGCGSLERCALEDCGLTRNLCCPIRDETCGQQNIVSTHMRGTRLIFTDGQDLYSLSLVDNSRQLLYRDDRFNITALAYSAEEHTVFWAAGPRIWSSWLTEEVKHEEPLGELHFDCIVRLMVFDWIAQNFFLVCENSTRITVCASQAANSSMLCSHLIEIDLRKITWLGLNPNAGLMFVGGPTRKTYEIFEAQIDGSSQRSIYQGGGSIPECNLNIMKNEISLLHLYGNGKLSTLNLTSGALNRTGSNFIRFNTTARALARDLAILQDEKGSFVLFFWDNGTVFTQRSIDMIGKSGVSLVMEREAQPAGENSCKGFGCDHICLSASSGPLCKCDFAYELMDDKHSCELLATRLESPENEDSGNVSEVSSARFPAGNTHHMKTCDDFYIHIFYTTAIILKVSCGVAICFCLRSRKKLCSHRTAAGITDTSVSFVATGNTCTALIGTSGSAQNDRFIELEI